MTSPGDLDDVDAAPGPPGAGSDEVPGPRRGLDGRTVMACALVALIAAALAGLVTSRLTADDDAGGGGPALVRAESVPDIALDRLGADGQVSLTDYRGQALVVNFWGSWCGPCVDEMPDLQRVHASLGDDVAFVGVNVRDREDKALELAESTGVTYDLVADTGGELISALGVASFPTTLLVLPDGTIADAVYLPISAERLCEKLNQTVYAGGLETCG